MNSRSTSASSFDSVSTCFGIAKIRDVSDALTGHDIQDQVARPAHGSPHLSVAISIAPLHSQSASFQVLRAIGVVMTDDARTEDIVLRTKNYWRKNKSITAWRWREGTRTAAHSACRWLSLIITLSVRLRCRALPSAGLLGAPTGRNQTRGKKVGDGNGFNGA